MTVPTDPFRLSKHLIDDHGVDPEVIDHMDSDELRAFHELTKARLHDDVRKRACE